MLCSLQCTPHTKYKCHKLAWQSFWSTLRPLPSVGIYVIGFSFPVVPKGKARIRVQISAAHTEEDIDRCVEAFIQTGRKHGVVS